MPKRKASKQTESARAAALARLLNSQAPADEAMAEGALDDPLIGVAADVSALHLLGLTPFRTVKEVLYPSAQAAADPRHLPITVVYIPEYTGPAFCKDHPKLVMLLPEEKEGDCRCRCKRRMVPYRAAEGTSIHSLQGMTTGDDLDEKTGEPKYTVQQCAVDLGDVKTEQLSSGIGLVAASRATKASGMCFTAPVDLSRLAACGTGATADALRRKLERLESKGSVDADRLADFYEPLLEWAEAFALAVRGIAAPWLPRDESDAEAADGASSDTDCDEPDYAAASEPAAAAAAAPGATAARADASGPVADAAATATPAPAGAPAASRSAGGMPDLDAADVAMCESCSEEESAGEPPSEAALGDPQPSLRTSRYFAVAGPAVPAMPTTPVEPHAPDLEEPILSVKRARSTPARPPCTVALRDALLKLFKQGQTELSVDTLLSRLAAMPKLPVGLAQRETVTRALVWLSMHDDNPLLTFTAGCVRSLLG